MSFNESNQLGYVGDERYGVPNGFGVYKSETSYYEGYWKNGNRHGWGKFKNGSDAPSAGCFIDDKYVGDFVGISSDGSLFKTDDVQNYKGKAISTLEDGKIYVGDWSNNKRNGIGELSYLDGRTSIKGLFVDNIYVGILKILSEGGNYVEAASNQDAEDMEVCLTYRDCSEYRGHWRSNMMNGYGKLFLSTGKQFDGYFVNDRFIGSVTDSDGNRISLDYVGDVAIKHPDGSVYNGHWSNNHKSGFGIYFTVNGDKYSGNWVDDVRSGEFVCEYSDGCVFKGNFYNDLMNGPGEMLYADGTSFKCNYKNGMLNGVGEFRYKNDDRLIGSWTENLRDGEFRLVDFRGNLIFKGNFKKGLMVGRSIFYINREPVFAIFIGDGCRIRDYFLYPIVDSDQHIFNKFIKSDFFTKEDIISLSYEKIKKKKESEAEVHEHAADHTYHTSDPVNYSYKTGHCGLNQYEYFSFLKDQR